MSYELYKKVIETYKSGNEEDFAVAACNWIDQSNINPFKEREPHLMYFKAKQYCRNWRNGGVDSRSAKRNLISYVRKIAELNLPYPYEIIEEEKQQEKDELYKK